MGPDFLCMGSTRSGTTFLHQHLREHPFVWLPPQKEIHYFTEQRDRGWLARKNLRHVLAAPSALSRALRGSRGVRSEILWQLRFFFGRRTDQWYLSLFDAPAGRLTGAIEPSYCKLSREMVRVVYEVLPDTKLLYMMRDPIERSWSSVTKSLAKNRRRPMSQASEADIMRKLARSTLYMSSYIDHIERWEEVFPKERFFFGFFEDIQNDPCGLLDRVCAHIGTRPFAQRDARAMSRPVNDTLEYKVPIPSHIEFLLSERLVGPTERLARRFGGPTGAWVDRMERVLARG